MSSHSSPPITAFVLAGGGSLGAIQVGMMHALVKHGVTADMVVGSSVGAINGAYYAGDPTLRGVLQLETIWRGFIAMRFSGLLAGAAWLSVAPRNLFMSISGIRKLIEDHLPFRNLQDARLPLHIVTTDILSGDSCRVLSESCAAEAIVASTAIPGAFAPIHYGKNDLADGAISWNTPIRARKAPRA